MKKSKNFKEFEFEKSKNYEKFSKVGECGIIFQLSRTRLVTQFNWKYWQSKYCNAQKIIVKKKLVFWVILMPIFLLLQILNHKSHKLIVKVAQLGNKTTSNYGLTHLKFFFFIWVSVLSLNNKTLNEKMCAKHKTITKLRENTIKC